MKQIFAPHDKAIFGFYTHELLRKIIIIYQKHVQHFQMLALKALICSQNTIILAY